MRGCGEKGLEGRTACANTHARVEIPVAYLSESWNCVRNTDVLDFVSVPGKPSSSTPNQAVSSIRGWSSSCKEIVASPCLRQAVCRNLNGRGAGAWGEGWSTRPQSTSVTRRNPSFERDYSHETQQTEGLLPDRTANRGGHHPDHCSDCDSEFTARAHGGQ